MVLRLCVWGVRGVAGGGSECRIEGRIEIEFLRIVWVWLWLVVMGRLKMEDIVGHGRLDGVGIGLVGDFVDDPQEQLAVDFRIFEQLEGAFVNVDGQEFSLNFDLAGVDDLIGLLDGREDGF